MTDIRPSPGRTGKPAGAGNPLDEEARSEFALGAGSTYGRPEREPRDEMLLHRQDASRSVAVPQESTRPSTVPELHRLVAGIRHDEAHGCAVLADAIRSLDATPTHATGALYEKAMAIDAPGSGWRS